MRSTSERVRTRHAVILGTCAALQLAACARADAPDSCASGDPGSVSAGRMPDAHEEAQFVELWSTAGSDDVAYLSTPLPLAVSRDGRAAVADFDLGEVFVIEPNGTWRGRIARRGAGPGELMAPVAAVWGVDGALHVYDIMKPAIVHFTADLSYASEERVDSDAAAAIFASGTLDWAGLQPSGATVFLPGLSAAGSAAAGTEAALRVDGSGAADTLRTGVVPIVRGEAFFDTGVPGYSRLAAGVGAGGRLAVIGGEAGWLIDVYDNDGARVLRLCADAAGQPLTDEERGRGVGEEQRERRPVYPSRANLYGQAGTTFDVFSPEGRHLRTLKLPAAARLQGALGDTIWAYELSELDEVLLVAYRVTSG